MRMTDRLKRIIHLAEGERKKTGCQFTQPEHLLSGCLLERTGAFAELAQKCRLDISSLRSAAMKNSEEGGNLLDGFPAEISEETKLVMEAAAGYMKRYGQIILNEGHLLKALLSCNSLAELAGEKNKQQMLAIGAAARDLAVHLATYSPPDKLYTTVRRAGKKDREMLAAFTEDNFSAEWAQNGRSWNGAGGTAGLRSLQWRW